MNRGVSFDESEGETGTGRAAFPPPRGAPPLRWSEVEDFFREHGCVIVGDPELARYREAWGALDEAGLAGAAEFAPLGLDRSMPRLRALCLLAMYLGIYQAAGEESALGGYFPGHPPRDRYFESLGLDIWELWELARTTGMIETDAEVYWEAEEEDDDVDDGMLYEFAADHVPGETGPIFKALAAHFGGATALFVSLWRSRTPPDEHEPAEDILGPGRPGDGKREVRAYVEEGMRGWRFF